MDKRTAKQIALDEIAIQQRRHQLNAPQLAYRTHYILLNLTRAMGTKASDEEIKESIHNSAISAFDLPQNYAPQPVTGSPQNYLRDAFADRIDLSGEIPVIAIATELTRPDWRGRTSDRDDFGPAG